MTVINANIHLQIKVIYRSPNNVVLRYTKKLFMMVLYKDVVSVTIKFHGKKSYRNMQKILIKVVNMTVTNANISLLDKII